MGHAGLALAVLSICTLLGCQKPAPSEPAPADPPLGLATESGGEPAAGSEAEAAPDPAQDGTVEGAAGGAVAGMVEPDDGLIGALAADGASPSVTSSSGVVPEIGDLAEEPDGMPTGAPAKAPPTALGKLVPLPLELPSPAFRGTPVPLEEPNVEPPRGKPRPEFLAPEGTVNLASGMPIAVSDPP